MDDVEDVAVGPQGIRLGQLLKLVGVADTGGSAKQLMADGLVRVNGLVEERRGAQLSLGDVVACAGQRWRVG